MKVRITFLDAPSDRHGVSGHDFDLTPIEAQDLLETARSMAAHSSAAPLRLRDAAEPQSREEAISRDSVAEAHEEGKYEEWLRRTFRPIKRHSDIPTLGRLQSWYPTCSNITAAQCDADRRTVCRGSMDEVTWQQQLSYPVVTAEAKLHE